MQQLIRAQLPTCDALLRDMLAGGPRQSREVLAELAALGFTTKQVRRARERQGVLIERAGNGLAMRSTWRLPGAEVAALTVAATGTAGAAALPPLGPALAPCGFPAPSPARHHPSAMLAEGEQRRHAARVRAFMGQGHDEATARCVADALVERDRRGEPGAGSCAECQNIALGSCPATPRPVIEVHGCWARRQCTP